MASKPIPGSSGEVLTELPSAYTPHAAMGLRLRRSCEAGWVLLMAIISLLISGSARAQSAPVFTAIAALRQTVNIGGTLGLNTSVNSTTPVTYQWKRNGRPISGATGSAYVVLGATPLKDAGWYQLVATNSSGTTTSAPMFINVVVPSPQVVVWGDNSQGQANAPGGLGGVVAISAGFWHSLALLADGTVVAWGSNNFGQANVPTGLTNVVAIAAGNSSSLALKSDGTVVEWGTFSVVSVSRPAELSGVVAIAADYTSLALKSDGTVVAWGHGDVGQTNVPAGLNNVVAIATGGSSCLALKSDGTVVGWGSNIYGQTNVPATLSGVTAVAVSDRSFALKADQSVAIWGAGLDVGQTKMPAGVTGVTALSARSVGNLALMVDGTVQGWGGAAVPSNLTRVVAVAMGDLHAVALRDGSNDTKPVITAQPAPQIAGPGQPVTFTVSATTGGAPSLTYQWRKNGVNIAGAVAANYTIGSAAGAAGSYDVLVSNYLGTVASAAAVLTVAQAPSIVTQPASLTIDVGGPAVFSASASGNPLAYQWQKNGNSIPGATSATYTIASVQASDAGNYACLVTNVAGVALTATAVLTVLPSARLANVSVRTTLGSSQSVIVGFVVSGGTKDLLVRAAGPALEQFGVSTAMTDPRVALYKDSTKILENDNWPAVLVNTFGGLGAFPFSVNSRDAALLQNLNGNCSAIVSGTGAGVVLVEAYDAGSGNLVRMTNVSARNRVGADADILFAGLYVAGVGTKRVLIRGVGPTIGGVPFNVPGTLADPKVELYNAAGTKMAENDNWDSALAATFASVGAFAFAPGSKDAALVAILNAGSSYSVQVKGADGGVGEALVEIYELP